MMYTVRLQRTYEFELEMDADSKEEIMQTFSASEYDTPHAHSARIVSIHEKTSTVRDLFA